MLNVRIDASGAYAVIWPRRQSEIINMGLIYVNYESSLPSNKQLLAPPLTLIQTTLAAAQAEQASAGNGEASRAAANA